MNKFIIAVDVAKESGVVLFQTTKEVDEKIVFSFMGGGFDKVSDFISDHLYKESMYVGECKLLFFENIHRNHKTTRKLGHYQGQLFGMLKDQGFKVEEELFNETMVFNHIFKKGTLKREDKKKMAIELAKKELSKSVKVTEDVAEAYVLMKYYIELNK